jgi:hypothetical protein
LLYLGTADVAHRAAAADLDLETFPCVDGRGTEPGHAHLGLAALEPPRPIVATPADDDLLFVDLSGVDVQVPQTADADAELLRLQALHLDVAPASDLYRELFELDVLRQIDASQAREDDRVQPLEGHVKVDRLIGE